MSPEHSNGWRNMNRVLIHALSLVISLVIVCIGGYFLIPLLQKNTPVDPVWIAATIALLLFGSRLAFELTTGWALSWGFRVVRRWQEPRKYWLWIGSDLLTILTVAVVIAYKFYHRKT